MKTHTRRTFIKLGAAAGGVLATAPFAIGRPGPSAGTRLNIALIGGGGIAKTAFGDCRDENVVAIADVDDQRGAAGFKEFPKARRYRDFRKLLDAHGKDLDLVIVSTPDHMHFPATYAAMERGIAVHTQKPLTHNIWQARTLRKAAHRFKVQTVMGNQGHNFEGMKLIREWYEAGMIGKVREVHAWTNRTSTNVSNARIKPPAEPVPDTLDWDQWIGPAAFRDYNKKFCPGGWRWWWEFGLGGLGDIGCHTLDIPKYALGLGYPTSVRMEPDLDFRQEFDGKTPKGDAATYRYEFPARGDQPAVTVYWYEGGRLPRIPEPLKAADKDGQLAGGGCLLVGDRNTIVSPGMRPTSPRLLDDWMELRRQLPPKTLARAVGNPVKEIKAAVRGEIPQCGSNFDYAVPLTETVILGTIAIRSGKTVEYDPDTMSFQDDSLDQYIKEPVRRGWEFGEGLL